MHRFEYVRATTIDEAVEALSAVDDARALAGGTNLVDLMKYDVMRPTRVVDIARLPLTAIEDVPGGALKLGALATNTDVAWDARVQKRYPLLSSAILAGASPQLRNVATVGGNLLQRTRCSYFYDCGVACNKREPGSGCPARHGVNRMHAILGASEQCIAVHPSDMCVALAALEAVIHVEGPAGARAIPMAEFHRLPGDDPQLDTTLQAGEIIIAVELPAAGFAANYTYLKLRDRLSYAFALVSVAAGLELDGGRITVARLALGGVAHKPWRVPEAEALLKDTAPDEALFEHVADRVLQGAQGQTHNAFKIPLARKAIVRALQQAAAGTPQTVADKRIV